MHIFLKLNLITGASVPVIAILTKFDILLEEMQQRVEEEGELEDEEAEEEAEKRATNIFDEHFKSVLMGMKHPPTQVIKLSNGLSLANCNQAEVHSFFSTGGEEVQYCSRKSR